MFIVSITLVKPFVVHFGAALTRLTGDELLEICRRNRDYHIESTADGDVLIKPLMGLETGH